MPKKLEKARKTEKVAKTSKKIEKTREKIGEKSPKVPKKTKPIKKTKKKILPKVEKPKEIYHKKLEISEKKQIIEKTEVEKEAPSEKKPIKEETILSKIKEAKEKSKPRKFTQSWDLSINLKSLNLKKPENRFNTQLLLPGGRGKDVKVAVIADSLATEAQKAGANLIIKKAEITSLAKDKKKLKKIANEYEWFFGEVSLMADIGKQLGTVLGPRGKMPKPIPPKAKVEPFVKNARNSVRIAVKESPVIHIVVGTEKLDYQNVANNVEAVYNLITDRLPKGKNNIRSVFLKLTMGRPVKLEMK